MRGFNTDSSSTNGVSTNVKRGAAPRAIPDEVPVEDLDLRRQIASWNDRHGERIPWLKLLHASWQEYNDRYFSGRLLAPVISIGMSAPKNLGDCRRDSDIGPRLQITIAGRLIRQAADVTPTVLDGARRFILDVMLHEMIHQHIVEGLGLPWGYEKSWHGHGPIFRDECNRIAPLIGITEQVGTKHQKRRPPCAHWPHNVRPTGWYMGFLNEADLSNAGTDRSWVDSNTSPVINPIQDLLLTSVGMIHALGRDRPAYRRALIRLAALGLPGPVTDQDQLIESAVVAIEQVMGITTTLRSSQNTQ